MAKVFEPKLYIKYIQDSNCNSKKLCACSKGNGDVNSIRRDF